MEKRGWKNGKRSRPDQREILPASVLRGIACAAEDGRLPSGGAKARRGGRGAAVKLTNILAVGGNAVITAEAETELGQLCDSYPGIAVCVEPESVPALVTGIEQALAMPKVNTVAREYAERTLEKRTC